MVRDRTVAVMEGSVEAGNLRQLRTPLQQCADRRQVVRLMQRCQRNVLLKIRHDRFVDDDRPVIFRPAMNDPVTNGQQV